MRKNTQPSPLAVLASTACLVALFVPFIHLDGDTVGLTTSLKVTIFAVLGLASSLRFWVRLPLLLDGILAVIGGSVLLSVLSENVEAQLGYWLLLIAAWLFAWLFAQRLTHLIADGQAIRPGVPLLIPLMFGATLFVFWEAITRGAHVSPVLLPSPSAIAIRISESLPILWADFQQTFLKSVIIGYLLGCGSGFLVAIATDRSPFLQRGLLPLGNFVSALPIIGIAPIMVMWFGFDWPSKAAVVVVMTFFPMFVNTITGLQAVATIEHDLMRTYAASYWQILFKLRLPVATPFIFNALKINSTLALIGAIVAEFFGTPIVGMGFRISTEVGRMNLDMVWAEVAMAAITGSLIYGLLVLLERQLAFWHISIRQAK